MNQPSRGATPNVTTDSNTGNQDSKCANPDSHRDNPETLGTNPTPISPITEKDYPPIFKVKSSKDDVESDPGQMKSGEKAATKVKTDGDQVVCGTELMEQSGGADVLEKLPSVKEKHGDDTKNTVLRTNMATCSVNFKSESSAEVSGNEACEFLQEDAVLGQSVENDIYCTQSGRAVETSHISLAGSSVNDVNSVSAPETRTSMDKEPIAINGESLSDGESPSENSSLDSSSRSSCANGDVNCVANGRSSPNPSLGSKDGKRLEPTSRCCKDLIKENGLPADENVSEKCPA